jgi:hypothetical protein
VQKIKDFQAWERAQERKIQALQDLSFPRRVSSKTCEGS